MKGRSQRVAVFAGMFFAWLVLTFPVQAADWPMWRYDAGRTASSPAELPATLSLQWSRQYTPRKPVWDDTLNQDLMPYDEVFEPVVMGKTLFLGFNDSDKLVALDTETGEERWRYYADGPIRFPAVAAEGRVYFASDDGHLYCLNAESGALEWKFRGGPSDRRILGNERLISTWPARGGPVLRDGTIYFAASIWPFMGTFLYALDAETGRVEWLNDSTSAQFIDQPHNSPAFAGIAPQGALAATEHTLIVPGGRSIPACFDRHTGKFEYFHLAKYGKSGGSSVFARGNAFFGHERADEFSLFDLETGERDLHVRGRRPVLSEEAIFFSGESVTMRRQAAPRSSVWEAKVDATGDLIRAGDRLYAAGQKSLIALQLVAGDAAPHVAWETPTDQPVARLVAADDKLFAVSRDGRLFAFGDASRADTSPLNIVPVGAPAEKPAAKQAAAKILEATGVREGYALVYGAGNGDLLEALALESELHLVAIDKDAAKVERLRRRFDEAGLYGRRIALFAGDAATFTAPPYMASLAVVADREGAGFEPRTDIVCRLFESLRPYGGTAWLPAADDEAERLAAVLQSAELPKGKWSRRSGAVQLVREGSLPGAGVWTHQYGNIANTIKSDDRLVKLPLGVLWFGGNSNLDVLPRHGHGPPEQVIAGRLVIQGMDCLSARDVYTGRVLWKVPLKKEDNFGVFFDETYQDTPLSTQYNQVHIPGANARGTNFVATEDRVYIVQGSECLVLDSATGKQLAVFTLPESADGRKADAWGYIGVFEDSLIAGEGFAEFTSKLGLPQEKKDARSKWRFVDYDKSASDGLVVMDRMTGEVRWRIEARHGFIHNAVAVADGILYCLDKLPPGVEQKQARRGKPRPDTYRLLALDMRTGKPRWEKSDDIFGTWLSVSTEHNVLLQSTRPSSDTVLSENGTRMIAYRADTGDVLWDKPISYGTPPILHEDRIIAGGRMFNLKTGDALYRTDPLTGIKSEWSYVSTKGCNYPIACQNLITFRSSAAAFYDLTGDGGTGHFGGFKSGCTSNLVAADGVLNAPDYTRTCSCSFQNQTSLALIHMPDLEMWTHNDWTYEGQRVERVGINLGAPGDRRSAEGTLWMEHPSVGGPSPDITVRVEGADNWFRHHASRISGEGETWVAASGVVGADRVVIRVNPSPLHRLEAGWRLAQGGDDGVEDASGNVVLAAGELALAGDTTPCQIGLRFAGVPIPRGAKVKSAWVQFESADKEYAKAHVTIQGEAADDAAPFAETAKNLSSRARTGEKVEWDLPPWAKRNYAGDEQRTPDLAGIVQEIVDRPGWKEGNALAIVLSGTGRHKASSFDRDAKRGPVLCVELENASALVAAQGVGKAYSYTVRLVFVEPSEETRPGDRVFDVSLDGKPVLQGLDVAAETGGPLKMLVKEFTGIPIVHELAIGLESSGRLPPVLCGVEAIAE